MRVPPSARQCIRSLTTWLLEQPISAEARSRASSSPSETRTFRRLGMASRLKSVTPRGAGHPPQREGTFGRCGRGGVSPGHRRKSVSAQSDTR